MMTLRGKILSRRGTPELTVQDSSLTTSRAVRSNKPHCGKELL